MNIYLEQLSTLITQNKYFSLYCSIINKALSREFTSRKRAKDQLGYVEWHHILPNSMGGPKTNDNMTYLTGREHFIVHVLLPKFTSGDAKRKMICALYGMQRKTKNQIDRYINARLYESNRLKFCKIAAEMQTGKTGMKRSPETCGELLLT